MASASTCLNCNATLTGSYCAACGQHSVDLAAPTWHVIRDAVADAIDVDSRILRTLRALGSPGGLTVEFLSGRRTPYIGPLKLFLLAGTVLTTTWVVTRGLDNRFYGLPGDASTVTYIKTVVRGLLAASLAVALASWLLGGRRRRLLDEAVFALHLLAALAILAAVVIWIAAGWKLVWGTVANVPRAVPSLVYLVFLPACAAGLAYLAAALRRVHDAGWWTTAMRAILLTAAGIAVLIGLIVTGRP